MKLTHTNIPVELLLDLPEGLKLVRRHGKEYLVVESLQGPDGVSLISETVRIHGEPSIRLQIRLGNREGRIFVDSFWGSHAKLYGFLPERTAEGDVVEASVPESGTSLMVDRRCTVPGCSCTRAIEMLLPAGGGKVYVCARLGCPGHAIELASLPKPVSESVSRINYFGAGNLEDRWLGELE